MQGPSKRNYGKKKDMYVKATGGSMAGWRYRNVGVEALASVTTSLSR